MPKSTTKGRSKKPTSLRRDPSRDTNDPLLTKKDKAVLRRIARTPVKVFRLPAHQYKFLPADLAPESTLKFYAKNGFIECVNLNEEGFLLIITNRGRTEAFHAE